MNDETITWDELVEVVHIINTSIQKQLEGKEYLRCTVHDDGFTTELYFCGIPIWNSDSDGRRCTEDTMEDIDTYIRRTIMKEINNLSTINLISAPEENVIYTDINNKKPLYNNIDPQKSLVSYGDISYHINTRMLLDRGLGEKELQDIVKLHIEKLKIFELMEQTDETYRLKQYAKIVEYIEYCLQDIWGFPRNKNYHEWYLIPKCKCPTMDNSDCKGSRYQIINGSCPIHGDDK